MIVVVYDISARNLQRQRNTVTEVFEILGIEDKKKIEVYNKIDLLTSEEANIIRSNIPDGIFISAVTGCGIERFKEILRDNLYGR